MPTLDKVYPNTKPVNDPYTHDWVQAKIDAFLKKGGQIKEIPRGVHAQDAQPMSVIRRKIEKDKNFGDDIRT
tara:strand:+ start:1582 stop:1797 length:216 start_codon:yes stop_codon:yes gene_type:complete